MATVAEVMPRDVLAVDPTASIGEAAEKMMDAGVGAVVVMEDMVRLTGIVTERAILRAGAQRAPRAEAGHPPGRGATRRSRRGAGAAVDDRERDHDRARDDGRGRGEDDVREELPPPPRLQGRPAARDRQPPPPVAVRVRALEGCEHVVSRPAL